MRVLRSISLAWIFALIAGSFAVAGDKPWVEVRSPHFRVLTNGSDNDGRRIAREFEQMRAVFANGFPDMRLESGAPLVVLAPRDEVGMKALAPRMKGAQWAGFFQHGEEKRYAVVRLDQDVDGAYQVVFHEYVHTLLHLNLRWIPAWLDEGLAEFYANTRIERAQMYVGAPGPRVSVLLEKPLIPLDVLLTANRTSPYYHDEDKVQVFYAESWALTHFLTFGPAMEKGKRLNEFNKLLQQGTEEKAAFEQVFGDLKQVQKDLDRYVHQFQFPSWVLPTPPQINEKTFETRSLSVADTEAELASYHLWSGNHAEARKLVEQALKSDPQLGLAHEDMGFLDFADGKDEDAGREFAQADSLDAKLYLSAYFRNMLSPAARSDEPGQQASFGENLLRVIDVNPDFAPAYVQLARLYVRQGDLSHALTDALKAAQLEPSLAGYRILNGLILLRMGHGTEAALIAKYTADHWYGADHDEALELWNSVPLTQRPAGDPPPAESLPAGVKILEGNLKSVTCEEQGITLVLEHDGQAFTFSQVKHFRPRGFSDTLWYGSDHFDWCHHLEGMRGVASYKPSTGSGSPGELLELSIRNDLPASQIMSKTETARPAQR